MQPNPDYKKLLSDVIKKQILLLGPTITLSRVRNVKGLTVTDDGTVTAIAEPPIDTVKAVIEEFVELSGLIVKKTLEPLLDIAQEVIQPAQTQQVTSNPLTTEPQLKQQPFPTPEGAQISGSTPQPTINQPAPAKNPLAA